MKNLIQKLRQNSVFEKLGILLEKLKTLTSWILTVEILYKFLN